MNFRDVKHATALVALGTVFAGCTKGTLPVSPNTGGSGGATGGSSGTGTGAAAGAAMAGASGAGGVQGLPNSFFWQSTGPLVAPIPDDAHPILSVKDPSVVHVDGRWHVFATTANTNGNWSLVYLSFTDWNEAANAQQHYLDENPVLRGYHAAPQVFYFEPQGLWYLIFQSGQPQYSTTTDLSRPETWSTPINFFATEPATVIANKGAGGWLDFWVICDDAFCHLFFTDDNGTFYRSQTPITSFPQGFGEPVVALKGTKETLFEGSATYRIKGLDSYLTLVEAFGPAGRRYYRSFVARTLDGEWTSLADTWDNPFAGFSNVTFPEGVMRWTNDFSHGELLRDGHDQTLTIDPRNLQFLFQGVDSAQTNVEYFRIPYRLGLLSLVEEAAR